MPEKKTGSMPAGNSPEELEEFYQSKKDPYGYKSNPEHAKRVREIMAFLEAPDDPFPRALDVGCSEGYLTAELALLHSDDVTGIDVSKTAVERAMCSDSRCASLEFVEADFLEYKPKRKFDLVVATGVLNFFQDRWEELADAIKRCLKKRGGRLLVSHVKQSSGGDGYLSMLEIQGFKAVRSGEFTCGGSVHSIHLLKQV